MRSRGAAHRPRPRLDVASLVVGLVLTGVAVTVLWRLLVGPLDWSLVTTIAPLGLVVIGVTGLALSRRT